MPTRKPTIMAALVILIAANPRTAREAISILQLSDTSGYKAITAMHRDSEIHIGDWATAQDGKLVPVYWDGPGEDAPKPKRQIGDENDARMWSEVRTRRLAQIPKPARDPLQVAFFGNPQAGASHA